VKALLATRFHPDFLLGLFFDPEDEGNMFLQNVGSLSTGYTALHPEDRTLHSHRCGNPKSGNGKHFFVKLKLKLYVGSYLIQIY
jgi:hypothetical protein